MSSSDGFCSNLTFNPGELGQIYSGHVPTAHHPSAAVSTMSVAQPSPTTASAPPFFDKPNTPVLAPSASPAPFPPPSPTRSNSTSSQLGNNPTPTLGSVPSVAATNPSFSGLPWTTPPQTPMSGVVSRPSSVSGSVLGKRDTSESEREEAAVPKKRRIAPTPVRNEDPSMDS